MPDLDQLFDSLVADVVAGTRAPGVSTAISRARRRRASGVAAAAAAVALIAVGGSLAVGTIGGADQPSPIGDPTTPSPTMAQESVDASPNADQVFETDFRAIVARVPGWSIEDTQPSFTGTPCAGDWSSAATGGGGGSFDVRTNGDVGQVWHAMVGFPAAAEASEALDRLADNLASCETVAWTTRPIARNGAVLASSASGVVWIQPRGKELNVLEAATADGPPPADVQVAVADWLVAYSDWQEGNK